jgi:hypothetical protein
MGIIGFRYASSTALKVQRLSELDPLKRLDAIDALMMDEGF